jgi:hypothetical protein
MSDPQTSMCTILKPYQGFERIYQGQLLSVPVPLTGVEGTAVPLADLPPSGPDYDPGMLRYVPVPMGSVINLWFPRIGQVGEGWAETSYTYQLRWRLRSIQDRIASDSVKVYQTVQTKGGITAPAASQPQLAVPASLGEVITPVLPTDYNGNLGLNLQSATLADSQGFYGTSVLNVENIIRGPLYFPPRQVLCVGNELAIYAYRVTSNPTDQWDFTNQDQGFSMFYGTGNPPSQHPWYPSHGIYLATMGGTSSILQVTNIIQPLP